MKKKTLTGYKGQYGVAIFVGKRKIGEMLFKNEADMREYVRDNELMVEVKKRQTK